MNWFLIALLAPALWSATNHIDKYLLGKYFKGGGMGSLMIFSSLVGLFVLPFILMFENNVFSIGRWQAFIIVVNGMIWVFGLLPYMYAIAKDEASVVVPLFQMIPIFTYLLGYFFLGEVLTTRQILASMLIITGAVGISLDLNEKLPKIKKDVLALMVLSSFCIALNGFIFKYVALDATFWVTSFWSYVGFVVSAVCLFVFVKSYRTQFLSVIRVNKGPVIGLNILNEVLNVTAMLSITYASLLAPLALVWVVNGFQPLFVFVYGVIITLFLPKVGRESLLKKHLLQKIVAIIVIFVGTYLLNI